MSERDNKWAKKLNTMDLDNESWLDLEDGVLQNIEQRIYGIEAERKSPWWLWSGMGLLVLAILGGVVMLMLQDTELATDVLSETSSLESEAAPKENTVSQIVGKISESAVSVSNQLDSELPKSVVDNDLSFTNSETVTQSQSPVRASKRDLEAIQTDFILSDFPSSNIEAISTFSKATTPKKNHQRLNVHSDLTKDRTSFQSRIPKNLTRGMLTGLPLMSSNKTVEIESAFMRKQFAISPSNLTEIQRPKSSRFFVDAGIGIVSLKLNQDFSAAVAPADFRKSAAVSYNIDLGYKWQLGNRLRFLARTGYEHVAFTSGHNATVTYTSGSETNNSNVVDLTMATPLGFISGDALITRSSSVPGGDTDLFVDLTNEHQYASVELLPLLEFTILDFPNANLSIQAGVGYKRIIQLRNNLSRVEIDEMGFSSSTTQVHVAQQSINKDLPFAEGGLRYSRDTGGRFRWIAFYKYKSGLKPIQEQAALNLSTSFSAHGVGIGIEF